MTENALREKAHACIDAIPTRRLVLLEPLLAELAEDTEESAAEAANFWERMKIKRRVRQMKRNPKKYAVPFR